MKIDIQTWNTDRRTIEAEIKSLKKVIRGQPYPSDTLYWGLGKLKDQATDLYRFRAWARGRQHQLLKTKLKGGLPVTGPVSRDEDAARVKKELVEKYGPPAPVAETGS